MKRIALDEYAARWLVANDRDSDIVSEHIAKLEI